MIAFDLMCANGHTFEGWFDNIESFEKQDSENMIICPLCENTEIKKILSPVTMKSSSRSVQKNNNSPIDYQKLAMEIVNYIQNEFEDTGPAFTREALKIHYGAAEARNIRGTATKEEEKILEDEGVPFVKFPSANKDNDKN
ncbi:MAG: DUF1178 family protein [Deltaproteobacteria bacterium]|nr:DUF1178 family protein [Deltaproteobacteria bacterium]